jgi:hypothetical protein
MTTNYQGRANDDAPSCRWSEPGVGIDERAERIRNRRLFVSAKKVVTPRPAPAIPPLEAREIEYPSISKVGKPEKRSGDSVWIWLFDVVKKPSQGRRVGQIDRRTCSLVEISLTSFARNHAYQTRILERANLSCYRGMSIGPQNISYRGNGSAVETVAGRKDDHRGNGGVAVRGRGLGPDSDEPFDEGNFAEAFEAGGALAKAWEAAIRAESRGSVFSTALDAATTGQVPSVETFCAVALTENPDVPLSEIREAYANLQTLIEEDESEGSEEADNE